MRKYGDYGSEFYDKAEEIFLSSPTLTIKDLADQSKELLGRSIDRKHLSSYANNANSAVRSELCKKRPFDEYLFGLEDIDEEGDLKVIASENEEYPFLAVVIEKKEHILPAIRAFLKRDRWQKCRSSW